MIEILTIGHSNHPIDDFLRILRKRGVRALADVRSAPHSRYAPQFNKTSLQRSLEAEGIEYHYSGAGLGGRPRDSALLGPDGQPDYDKMAAGEGFRTEIEALIELGKSKRLCLMCGEADPMCCHRENIVARALRESGVRVTHISPDGTATRAGRGET